MIIRLKRFMSTDKGTFGVLTFREHKFYTVEKPWNRNLPEISCVSAGNYLLEPHKSVKYGNVLCLVNDATGVTHFKESISKRYACLIHVANFEKDGLGCIGLGSAHLGSMVTNSRTSIALFYSLVDPRETHSLVVGWGE